MILLMILLKFISMALEILELNQYSLLRMEGLAKMRAIFFHLSIITKQIKVIL